jgi:Undecaprenyl-phosphate glucose phosphotransferase
VQPSAGKQLFAHPYHPRRRKLPGGARPARLLSGQALAEAQRLSRPRLRGQMFVAIQMAADLVLMLLAGVVARTLLPGLPGWAPETVGGLWVAALVTLAAIRVIGGYAQWRMRLLTLALPRMVLGVAAGLATVGAIQWLKGQAVEDAAIWAGLWAALALPLLAAVRVLVWLRLHALTRLGVLEHRLAVVGGGAALEPTLRALGQTRREGYRVCGFFDERSDSRSPDVVAGLHKTGNLDDLIDFVRIAQIDTVIVAVPQLSSRRLLELMTALSPVPVEIRAMIVPGMAEIPGAPRSRIGALHLVELCRPPIGGLRAVQKRVFDLVTAIAALVIAAPVMVAVAVAVRLDSPGPVLFRQTRHGFNARPIQVLKFRSMHADRCDPSAVRPVRREDDRVTRVGRFIRRTSLDELPQLFNVLSGELSMVGPRPHATAARTGDILFDEVTEAYSARHRVKPGITGWAQINGWRGEMNSAEKIRARVEHDLYYIENWSLWFDLKILARTPLALVQGKNAY